MEDKVKKAERLLMGAYALRSSEDNVEYYRNFAQIYDDQYAEKMGYSYPAAVAEVYRANSTVSDVPVADIGCGTGLVASALGMPPQHIDGMDISEDMLKVAREKSIYRHCYQVDLKSDATVLPGDYGAVVSAGTFTFGHLGPEALAPLLDLGLVNAIFCIGVNTQHFEDEGFSRVFSQLHAEGRISQPEYKQQNIYSSNNTEHASDVATVVVYRKL